MCVTRKMAWTIACPHAGVCLASVKELRILIQTQKQVQPWSMPLLSSLQLLYHKVSFASGEDNIKQQALPMKIHLTSLRHKCLQMR